MPPIPMAPDTISMLSAKIDEVKKDLSDDIAEVKDKLDGINKWMLDRPPACPKPGLCVTLEQRIDAQQDQIQRMQIALAKLQSWQSWIMGGMGLLVFFLTIFGPSIRALFRLP